MATTCAACTCRSGGGSGPRLIMTELWLHARGRDRDQWLQRSLLVGATSGPVNNPSLTSAVRNVYEVLGLTYDQLGWHPAPIEHLRKIVNTELRRAAERGEVSASEAGDYLGHDR